MENINNNKEDKNKEGTNPFFSIDTLVDGGNQMLNLVKQCAQDTFNGDGPVHPDPKPGFLRNQLSSSPPEEGSSVKHLIEMTKNALYPGVMKWQSPKFFGYYPNSINVTSIFGDMFAIITNCPNFNFGVSPVWTELQNIVVDWAAQFLGLPEDFLLKNSGGGIISNSATQSIFTTVHMAKYHKRKQLGIQLTNPQILKFVGYFGQGSHISSERGLGVKDIHYRRAIPYVYNQKILNYELDVDKFQQMLEEDVSKGLIPFWCGFSYGNTSTAAIDISQRACQLCKKYKIWINLDAAFLGSTWISPKYRPKQTILDYIDTIDINLSKLLLNGTGGSLLYVRNKNIITESFNNASNSFHFYKNQYTGLNDVVDYKDWIVGLYRRNSAIKMYYTFEYYGVKMMREAVEGQQQKFQYLLSLIAKEDKLFKLYTKQYAIMSFHVLDKDGQVSDELTREVNKRIKNIKEGFSTPGDSNGRAFVRICVGHFHTTDKHIKTYFDQIVNISRQLQSKM